VTDGCEARKGRAHEVLQYRHIMPHYYSPIRIASDMKTSPPIRDDAAPSAVAKAIRTDRWTEIMCRSLSARSARRWRFVSFRGVGHREWRGIVDMVAIRKDTRAPTSDVLKRGDLFDLILIQLKGGSAKLPSQEEVQRLSAVAKTYRASNVVLFEWKKGVYARFSILTKEQTWRESTAKAIFGA
jgi:hypothetical protein